MSTENSFFLGVGPGPYVDGEPAALEVTIDSAANQGNPRIENNSSRQLRITVPANSNPKCGLPTLPTEPLTSNFDFQFLGVDVNKEVSGGVYGIDPGGFRIVPMRIVSFHDEKPLFLHFGSQGPGPCKGLSGLVRVERPDNSASWTVTGGSVCVDKQADKGQNDFCFVDADMKFSFVVEK